MQVVVSELSLFERTLEVTVDASRVENAYQKAFGRAAKRLRVPGFRPGKVPLPMAKKYITDQDLKRDVINEVVDPAFSEALRQNNLEPISQPRWELVQDDRGKELIFKVSFEVKPVLPIEGYQGVELKNERQEIGPEQVDAAVEELRATQAKLVDLAEERGLELGDLALVDYSSTLDGENVDGGAATNYLMEVRAEHFIPGFVDNLVGLKGGEEKEFDIEFPADYPNQELAGKQVHFSFKLHQIKIKELPPLDDDLAKAVSPFSSLEELRKELQDRLETNEERRVREQVAIKIIDKLLPQVEQAAVPRALHQDRTNIELRRRLQQLEQAGINPERYLADRNISQQQWVTELSVMGMLESRVEILLNSIATQENLHPSEEELEELLQAEARNRGVSVAQLRKAINDEGTHRLVRYALLRAKVMDYLFDNAKIEFVAPGTLIEEPTPEEQPSAEEAKPKKAKAKKAAAEEQAAAPEEPAEESKPKARAKKAKEAPAPEAEAEAGEEKPKPKRASKKKAEEA